MTDEIESERSDRARQRRGRVVAAARELFARHGFHATGMASISQESGVLVGQIYRDFANKEAIVAAIVEHDVEQCLSENELRAALQTGDRSRVRGWIARFLEGNEPDDPQLVVEILAEAGRNPRMAAIFHGIDQRVRDRLTDALALLTSSDDEARLRCLADTIMLFAGGVFHQRVSHRHEVSAEVLALLMTSIDRELADLA